MPNDEHAEMNRRIRAAFGRPSAQPTEPGDSDSLADRVRAQIASEFGLSDELAPRLRGETPAELAEDASRLARVAESLAEPPPGGGFDGGARGGGPPTEPTFESVLRAQVEAKRRAVSERALDLDHANRHRGGQDA